MNTTAEQGYQGDLWVLPVQQRTGFVLVSEGLFSLIFKEKDVLVQLSTTLPSYEYMLSNYIPTVDLVIM